MGMPWCISALQVLADIGWQPCFRTYVEDRSADVGITQVVHPTEHSTTDGCSILEVPACASLREACTAAAAVKSTFTDEVQECLAQTATLDSACPQLLSIGSVVDVALKDATFSTISGGIRAAAQQSLEDDARRVSLQKPLLPPHVSGMPGGGAPPYWTLDSPLSCPLAVAGSAEAAAFAAAVMADAQAVAAKAGLPAAAAAVLEPQVPQIAIRNSM